MKKLNNYLAIATVMASFCILMSACSKKDAAATPTPAASSSTSNTFKITSYGEFTAPVGSGDYGGVITQNTGNLAFGFISKTHPTGATNGGGNIDFPLGATTGTYTVIPQPTNHVWAAGQCSVDMSCDVGSNSIKNKAQSGTISLTVTGSGASKTYKIVFTDLSSLSDESTPKADKLSGNFSF